MGNTDSKLNFRKAVIQLTTKTQVCVVAAVIRGGYQQRARACVRVCFQMDRETSQKIIIYTYNLNAAFIHLYV